MKPQIVVKFDGEVVDWLSVGWKNNSRLMGAARKAINDGKDQTAVIKNLEETFEVIQEENE
jgi:hypothetical protein